MSKVVEYVGFFHALKDRLKESWTQYRLDKSSCSGNVGVGSDGFVDDRETNFRVKVKEKLERLKQQTIRRIDRSSSVDSSEDFSHLTRPKTRRELLQISAAVMGIEFSYAAETAFVSPLLLNIGLRHRHMTLMWCLSPLVGFFVTPLLGSLSDGCRSQLGRRRPFILLLSIGIILGLILVPNGKLIGRLLGDTYKDDLPAKIVVTNSQKSPSLIHPRVLTSSNPIPIPQKLLQQVLPTSLNGISRSGMVNLTLDSSSTIPPSYAWDEIGIPNLNWTSEKEKPIYSTFKKVYNSKYSPTMEEHGFRVRNNLDGQEDVELQEKEFIKSLGKPGSKNLKLTKTQNGFNNKIIEDEQNDASKSNNENFNIANEQLYTNPSQSLLFEKEEELSAVTTTEINEQDEDLEEKEPDDKSLNEDESSIKNHPWGLVFTVLGTVLLDFDADACQSPARAYMLDVTIPEDHARGLSTFTVMAGLGGCLGYLLGALNWENTFIGHFFGGQVRAVFTLVLFIFIGCVIATIRSFREIPIDRLWASKPSGGGPGISSVDQTRPKPVASYSRFEEDSDASSSEYSSEAKPSKNYGATVGINETSFNGIKNEEIIIPLTESAEMPTFKEYVKTIIQLPKSLQWLCLTNFFCWMSLVCYSLYFTDFVGEAVFNGDPTAPLGSVSRENYDSGVRFGCWGMSLYSLSCSIYSLCIESLVSRFGAKRVYITGQLVYSVGMIFMAITRHPFGVIIFSWTAGIMYATLFTMPYLLVARYHAAETFDIDIDDLVTKPPQLRGLGTDVAIVSSMVFLAQMTQALTLGSIVAAVGSTTAIVIAAAIFASCGAMAATKVLYLDL